MRKDIKLDFERSLGHLSNRLALCVGLSSDFNLKNRSDSHRQTKELTMRFNTEELLRDLFDSFEFALSFSYVACIWSAQSACLPHYNLGRRPGPSSPF